MYRVKEVVVSPKLAQEWLSRGNTWNRKMSDRYVAILAALMSNGQWIERSGDSIKFNSDGTLLDGQHRLQAQVLSGTTLKHLVIYDVDKQARKILDTNKKMPVSEVLRLYHGVESNHKAVAASYSQVRYFFKGNWGGGAGKVTVFYVEKAAPIFGHKFVSLLSAIPKTKEIWPVFAKGCVIGTQAILMSLVPDEAVTFWNSLVPGDNLSLNNPIYHLRNYLMRAKLGRRDSYEAFTKKYVTAFDLYIGGASATKIVGNNNTVRVYIDRLRNKYPELVDG